MRAHPHRWSYRLASLGLAATAAVLLGACSGSSKAASPSTTVSFAGEAIGTTKVAGVGTVISNALGVTVYILTTEKGGKLACTATGGCTSVWPDVYLPIGVPVATAENGTIVSKLGVVKSPSGTVIVTYAGYPLHTYSGDSGPGRARGQGLVSFGGTWETITPGGTPVVASG